MSKLPKKLTIAAAASLVTICGAAFGQNAGANAGNGFDSANHVPGASPNSAVTGPGSAANPHNDATANSTAASAVPSDTTSGSTSSSTSTDNSTSGTNSSSGMSSSGSSMGNSTNSTSPGTTNEYNNNGYNSNNGMRNDRPARADRG